ncbi:MAG: chloride channel protein [Alphaproteobacteria bacterium]|nr:chloride channel protein [Alphaproteobacteria bacterium]
MSAWAAETLPRLAARQPALWLLALLIGIIVGHAAVAFYLGLTLLERHVLRIGAFGASDLPWLLILAVPALGGLGVGLLLQFAVPEKRPLGIPDLIAARAVGNGQVGPRGAILNALLALLALGTGASAGREGPVAHLGGGLASIWSGLLGLSPNASRTLLGAGVAAAVSASFNAPIAGVLFALEVVLRHYALRAFGPIVVASAAGALVARMYLGEYPAFVIPSYDLVQSTEYLAIFALGLVCTLVAAGFIHLVKLCERLASELDPPLWLRPAIGGALVGLIARAVPQVLGVGYGVADAALKEEFGWGLLAGLLLAKILATAITLASRLASGVFSPSLVMGASAGGLFGLLLGELFPGAVTSPGFYAIIGMGAVSAAVLGAPISTALIAFELTLNYETAIALLLAVSVSTVMTRSLLGHSFFLWQLERRGIDVREGLHLTHLQRVRVHDFMRPVDTPPALTEGMPVLTRSDTLGRAFTLLEEGGRDAIPVTTIGEEARIVGIVTYADALRAYNRALVESDIEANR